MIMRDRGRTLERERERERDSIGPILWLIVLQTDYMGYNNWLLNRPYIKTKKRRTFLSLMNENTMITELKIIHQSMHKMLI